MAKKASGLRKKSKHLTWLKKISSVGLLSLCTNRSSGAIWYFLGETLKRCFRRASFCSIVNGGPLWMELTVESDGLCLHNLKLWWALECGASLFTYLFIYVYVYCTHINQHITASKLTLHARETRVHFSSYVEICCHISFGVPILHLNICDFSGCATGVHPNFKLTNFWRWESLCGEKFRTNKVEWIGEANGVYTSCVLHTCVWLHNESLCFSVERLESNE